MQRWNRRLLLLKIETTYGTDSAPTGAANAILARDVTFEPGPAEVLDRPVVKPTLGPLARPIAGRHATLSFEVELTGAGSAGAVPAYGPAIRACGFSETVNATVDVTYAPVSSGEESCTVHFWIDGTRHAMVGCRGNLGLIFEAGEVPRARVQLTGLYVNPSAVAQPSADFTAFRHPAAVTKDNTPTFTLDGVATVLRSLELDMRQNVVFRDFVGAEEVQITGRDPGGSISFEAPALGTKDWFAVERAETPIALSLVHGSAAGSIVELSASKVQLLNPSYQDVDGAAFLGFDLALVETSGDDELSIKVR